MCRECGTRLYRDCRSYCERVHDTSPEKKYKDMITLLDWFDGNFVESTR